MTYNETFWAIHCPCSFRLSFCRSCATRRLTSSLFFWIDFRKNHFNSTVPPPLPAVIIRAIHRAVSVVVCALYYFYKVVIINQPIKVTAIPPAVFATKEFGILCFLEYIYKILQPKFFCRDPHLLFLLSLIILTLGNDLQISL